MNEMQFQYPTSALWLFAIVILIGMFALRERAISQFLSRVADPDLLDTLLPGRNSLHAERKVRDILVILVGLAFLFALARPQWGFTWQESIKRGVDIVVAVDVSQSMLAEDIKPNRLVRAQREIMDLLDQLKGDRIGLVSFAGTAYLESPLTLDYSAFRGFLQSLSPKLIPIQGTNIEAAIRVSIRALKQTHKGLVSTSRSNVIVLITDGENFDGNVETAGEIARAEDVQIYIIGVGTENGAPIPGTGGYRRDDQGELILSRLHKNSLKSLAKSTGGTYVSSITSDQDTFSIYEQGIRKAFEGTEIDYMRAKTWNEYFQIPLGLGIAVLLIGPWGLLFRRTKEMLRSRRKSTVPLLFFFFCLQVAVLPSRTYADSESAEFRQEFNEGSGALGRGDFASAIAHFSKLREAYPDDLRVLNAEAISYYRLGQYEKAATILQHALEKGGDKQQMAEILYNLGNTAVQLQQYQEAISYYEQSLNLMPDEQEAKDNLEYVKKLIEQQEQEDKNEDSDENKSEEDKEQENKDEENKKEKNQKNKDNDKKQNDKKDQGEESSSEQNQRSEEEKDENKKDKNKEDEDKREDGSGEQSKKDSSKPKKEESDKSEQSDNREKSQDNKDPKSEKDEKEKEREEANQGNPQSEPTPSSEQQAQAAQSEASEQEAELSEQLEAQLENVEERSGTRMKFRLRKGIQQLDTFNMPAPEKDW